LRVTAALIEMKTLSGMTPRRYQASIAAKPSTSTIATIFTRFFLCSGNSSSIEQVCGGGETNFSIKGT
jgi:hypothetical protein